MNPDRPRRPSACQKQQQAQAGPEDQGPRSSAGQTASAANWEAETVYEADEQHRLFPDSDSTLGDDVLSATTSLKSAVTRYIHENGRRYHAPKDGSYFMPNDDQELDRLDLAHHTVVARLNGRLHLAPIPKDTHRILDLGTGTGIWAIEMGDRWPSAYIVGNDISPVQPRDVPPNVFFEVDDMENDWVYSAKFDYIHSGLLVGCIKDWPRLMQQAYDALNPGGWFECADVDLAFYTHHGQYTDDCPIGVWLKKLSAGISSIGMEPFPARNLERWMRDAGFTNITSTNKPLPVGPWPKDKHLKEVGAYFLAQFLDGLDAFSLRVFMNVYQWQVEEVKVLCADVRKDACNMKMQMQSDYRIVYGQKPH